MKPKDPYPILRLHFRMDEDLTLARKIPNTQTQKCHYIFPH